MINDNIWLDTGAVYINQSMTSDQRDQWTDEMLGNKARTLNRLLQSPTGRSRPLPLQPLDGFAPPSLTQQAETSVNINVFYLMRPLEFDSSEVSVESDFKFTMFLPDYLVTQQIDAIKAHLDKETFSIWFVRGSIGCSVFIVFFAFIIWQISVRITRPIVQFTRKIQMNIEQVRKLKKDKSQGKQLH
jgi:hypothetical protein